MIILFFSRFDYAKLKKYAKPLYILNLFMLVAVMFVGTSALGAQRWINSAQSRCNRRNFPSSS